jgi:hypothetical protein
VTTIGLTAWLVIALALMTLGWLAACVRRDRGGLLVATVLALGGASLALAALVRHAVLPESSLALLLIALVIGGVLLLLGELMAPDREEER